MLIYKAGVRFLPSCIFTTTFGGIATIKVVFRIQRAGPLNFPRGSKMTPLQVLQTPGQNSNLTTAQQNFSHVPQILLLLLLGVLASLGAPPPSRDTGGSKLQCVVADIEYNANETWYRHLQTSSASHCVRCICKSDGFSSSVNCSNVTCNQALCEGSKKDECCDVCQGSAESTKILNTMHLSSESGRSRMPCLHNGKIYQDGEEFSSNATGLQAQKPNQCIHCMCQAGLVLCRLRTCIPVHCITADTKNCCPTCKEEETSEEENQPNPVLVTIMVSDGQSTTGAHESLLHDQYQTDCTAAGVTYSHGSSWHPVIGPFGPMDCVFCKCQFGKIECSRLNCPPAHKLPCSKPIQVPGHCCPQCTGESLSPALSSEESIHPVLHHPSISVTMEQKSTQVQTSSSSNPNTMTDCLPPQTNTLVFRSHAASSSSAYYQYAFQSAAGDLSTRLLTWTIKDGHIGDFSEQHLSKEEFKILMGTFKFKPQGATRTKFMEKFIRKSKKLPDHCGNRCATKIQRLEQVLHLREITKRQKCLAQETSFH